MIFTEFTTLLIASRISLNVSSSLFLRPQSTQLPILTSTNSFNMSVALTLWMTSQNQKMPCLIVIFQHLMSGHGMRTHPMPTIYITHMPTSAPSTASGKNVALTLLTSGLIVARLDLCSIWWPHSWCVSQSLMVSCSERLQSSNIYTTCVKWELPCLLFPTTPSSLNTPGQTLIS